MTIRYVNVCMYVYLYMCVRICKYLYLCIYEYCSAMHVDVLLHTYTYSHTRTHTNKHTNKQGLSLMSDIKKTTPGSLVYTFYTHTLTNTPTNRASPSCQTSQQQHQAASTNSSRAPGACQTSTHPPSPFPLFFTHASSPHHSPQTITTISCINLVIFP